jgi:DNA-binding NarL/FixJ family response regulator
MNTGARPSPVTFSDAESNPRSGPVEEQAPARVASLPTPCANSTSSAAAAIRVYVAANNLLVREALVRTLTKQGIEVVGLDSPFSFDAEMLARKKAQVLLLISQGNVRDDLTTIQRVHSAAPGVRILLIGAAREEGEFLQCVRAGISGYLWHEASAAEVLDGIHSVQAGHSVCPGELCTELFRYFEQETPELPCASPRQRLGLTRREQQIVPLIAKGFTNKEIANHFCLSEQTVKNHLYRMKHKVGAEDRLNIVQRFRTQGFLL